MGRKQMSGGVPGLGNRTQWRRSPTGLRTRWSVANRGVEAAAEDVGEADVGTWHKLICINDPLRMFATTGETDRASRQGTAMAYLDVSRIASWHAHVYFDAASRDAAREFREVVTTQFGNRVEMGRFHERDVGPHPRWSYQIAFEPMQFSDVVGWLALNHGALDVFVHPNTDNELRDHRDCALWLGRSYQLDLSAVGG